MKIKTSVNIVVTASISIALIAIGTSIVTGMHADEMIAKKRSFDSIVERIIGLRALTYDYLLHRTDRARDQWWLTYDDIGRLLTLSKSQNPDHSGDMDELVAQHHGIKDVFEHLLQNEEKTEPNHEREPVLRAVEKRLAGRLLVETQTMVFDVLRLSAVLKERSRVAERRAEMINLGSWALVLLIISMKSLYAVRSVVKPILKLHEGAVILAAGNLDHKVAMVARDEIGDLSRALDQMTDQIRGNLREITLSRDELAEEIAVREKAEAKLQQQLVRMNLLNVITRAIAERQDLESIFRVVLYHLEDHLPIDVGCICLLNSVSGALTVAATGLKTSPIAVELGMDQGAVIPIDRNGLRRCIHGQTVYDPDTTRDDAPMLKNLAQGGLYSMAALPLVVESQVLGMLMAARREKEAFSSGECEFLRQLSEHVALAVHQKGLYETLQKAYDELRETQQAVMQQERLRAVGQMASGIAHDINNALGPVALYTESLLENEPNLSERAISQLKTIQSATEDIADTVARMREFYRKREDQVSLFPVNLNELTREVIELTRPRWKDIPQERGVVISIQLALQDDLPPVIGIESELRGALTNLVFNAIDAMPDGGGLTLRTRTEGSHVVLEVIDTGGGMSDEVRQRCFEPFFSTKGERGTGLGLSMVYGVVQRHEAEIVVQSEVGRGTIMRLLFRIQEPAGRPACALPATLAASAPLRILCIDDDPLMRVSLRETLENDGHTVEVCDGGRSGIEAFRSSRERAEPFDVIITDLGMPYVDGRTVARAVKQDSPATPVILLTGWGTQMHAEGEAPACVDLVLSKPPKVRDLREALKELSNRNA